MEILPGVHQIPGLRWSNAYLLVDAGELTLIDTGMPGDGRKIFGYIQSIGRDPTELARVVLTHSHPDHTGPLKSLSQCTGAAITVHRAETLRWVGTGELGLHYSAQPPAFGWNVPFLHRIPAHQLIEDGQILPVLGGLQVLHTPGHTPGSVCLYWAKQAVLFTGDTLLADGHGFHRSIPFPGSNLREHRASLERLAQLPFEAACAGHGKPVLQEGAARLREMLSHDSWIAPRWKQFNRWSSSRLRMFQKSPRRAEP